MTPFYYDNYNYDVRPDGLHILFSFRFKNHIFQPTAFFPSRPFLHPENVDKQLLDLLVFNIGMIELVSYWKAFCPPEVIVKPRSLNPDQLAFWKKLYFNGLGEFFFTNNIDADPDNFMHISCTTHADDAEHNADKLSATTLLDDGAAHAYIIPIGGGKDSVVTLELLKARSTQRPIPLIMNPRGATVQCIERAGYSLDEVIVINRTIHPHLLEVNKQGALNGHTPFSAMLAFYSLLAATLTGKQCRIALSNENSANESTVLGTSVNHQYSKSLEFENDFRHYVDMLSAQSTPLPSYFSFLRPLSELQIASLFSQYPHYFDVFKSCNVGSKTDIWCGHCAKCLFAYIILSPFIPPEQLNAIFGKNMLDDLSLQLEFNQLVGLAETKPFECVGTVSEVNSALSISIAKWYPYCRPALLANYTPLPVTTPLDSFFTDHNLAPDDFHILSSAFSTNPPRSIEHLFRYRELFNLLAGKEILITGFGREGKSSLQLLQTLFPRRNFDVAENDQAIVAALASKQYDLVLKSPGIPMSLFDNLCKPSIITSQCDIFLQVYGDKTVGITGTKGKSTTSSLIASVLSAANRSVILAGNIGIPLFDIIPQLNANSTVVAELSCHQLEIIHRSPHVSLLLNLFQEHLDHYRSYEEYKLAKLQIALRQQAGDHFFYCADNDDLTDMVNRYNHQFASHIHPLSQSLASQVASFHSSLEGNHNRFNILAAYQAVKLLGVSDSQFADALSRFQPLEHRLEPVATFHGISFYNDSISTIPQATIAAIEALGNVQSLILGGFDRGIEYSPLADYLLNSPLGKNIRSLVLLGSAGRSIYNALLDSQFSTHPLPFSVCAHYDADYSMEQAVAFAADNTQNGHTVLLSPAASSYDHYKNFEYRGRHFKECVMALIASHND